MAKINKLFENVLVFNNEKLLETKTTPNYGEVIGIFKFRDMSGMELCLNDRGTFQNRNVEINFLHCDNFEKEYRYYEIVAI
jgi:hypothetical protein